MERSRLGKPVQPCRPSNHSTAGSLTASASRRRSPQPPACVCTETAVTLLRPPPQTGFKRSPASGRNGGPPRPSSPKLRPRDHRRGSGPPPPRPYLGERRRRRQLPQRQRLQREGQLGGPAGERPVSTRPAGRRARPRPPHSPLPAVLQSPLAAPLRHAQQLLLDLPQVREVAAAQPRRRHPAAAPPGQSPPRTLSALPLSRRGLFLG